MKGLHQNNNNNNISEYYNYERLKSSQISHTDDMLGDNNKQSFSFIIWQYAHFLSMICCPLLIGQMN